MSDSEIESLVFLNDIKSLEADIKLKSIIKLDRLHTAYHQRMFQAAGFNTIEEWLDSYGINGRSGTISQLLAIAKQIIPWCESHRIQTAGGWVNLDWFKRIVDNKCLVARACLMVSLFRRTIGANSPLSVQTQTITEALSAIENPRFSRRYLIDSFGGYGSAQQIQGTSYQAPGGQTVFIFETTDPAQTQWIEKKLQSTTQLNRLGGAFYEDVGLIWLARLALQDEFWI